MDTEALVERATALLELGRPVEAEAEARRALAGDPSSAAAQVALSHALTGQRRWAEAVDAARGAVAADPERADAFVALAWALVGTTGPTRRSRRPGPRSAWSLTTGPPTTSWAGPCCG